MHKASLWMVCILCVGWLSFGLAENGASYDATNDTYQQTNAPANTLPIEQQQTVAQKQVENWNKLEDKTGKEVTYSFRHICDKSGACMPVDPPRFSPGKGTK